MSVVAARYLDGDIRATFPTNPEGFVIGEAMAA